MADDIEEFLKRVAEKRRGQQQGNRAPAPPRQQQPPPQQRPPQQRPPQRPAQPQQPPQQPPPQRSLPQSLPPVVQRGPAEISQSAPNESTIQHISTDDVKRHAQQYLSRDEFEDRSKQAGMHAKPLSHLESRVGKNRSGPALDAAKAAPEAALFPTTTSEPVDQTANQVATLFRSPEAFRSAFLMSLILERPNWDDE